MEQLQNFASKLEEVRAAAIARPGQPYRDRALNPAGPLRHDDDAIAHVNRFVDIVRDQKHCGAARLPEAKDFVLHPHPREGVERAEGFVEQQHFRMIDQRAGERDALGHATRKMVGIRIGETFQADKTHEFVYFVAFLVKNMPRNQTGFDIPPHGQPREEIRILKHETALGIRTGDRFGAYHELAGIRRIEAGNQAKKGGFPAAAGADEGNQFAGRE